MLLQVFFWNPIQEVQLQDMTRFNQNSFFENQLACSQTKFSLLFYHKGWQSGKTSNIKSKSLTTRTSSRKSVILSRLSIENETSLF